MISIALGSWPLLAAVCRVKELACREGATLQNCFLPVSNALGCIQIEKVRPTENSSHRQVGLCLLQPPAWWPESHLGSCFLMCKSQVHLPAQKPTGCVAALAMLPRRGSLLCWMGTSHAGEDGGWETGVSSPLPHPLAKPPLSPVVSLPGYLVSTHAQLCVITFTPSHSGAMCESYPFLFQVSFEMFLRTILISL